MSDKPRNRRPPKFGVLAHRADRVLRRLWPGLLPPPRLEVPPRYGVPGVSIMRWKLPVSIADLRRLTRLLTQSVEAGVQEDAPLRDQCLELLERARLRRESQEQARRAVKAKAALLARVTYGRWVRRP